MLFFKAREKQEQLMPPPPPFPLLEIYEREQHDKPKLIKSGSDGVKKAVAQKKIKPSVVKKVKKNKISKSNKKRKRLVNSKTGKPIKRRILEKRINDTVQNVSDFKIEGIDIPEIKPKIMPKKAKVGTDVPGFLDEGKKHGTHQAATKLDEDEINFAIQKAKTGKPPFFSEKIKVDEVMDLIENSRKALTKFDLDQSKKLYVEAMKIYHTLTEKDKTKVYKDLHELYKERKLAEKFK